MTLWSVSKLVAATLVLALLSRGFTEHWSLFIALCCFIESSVVLGFSGDTPARGLLNPAVFLLSACQPGPSAWTCPCRSAPTVRWCSFPHSISSSHLPCHPEPSVWEPYWMFDFCAGDCGHPGRTATPAPQMAALSFVFHWPVNGHS